MNKRKGQVMKDGLYWEDPPPHLVSLGLLSLYYPVTEGKFSEQLWRPLGAVMENLFAFEQKVDAVW